MKIKGNGGWWLLRWVLLMGAMLAISLTSCSTLEKQKAKFHAFAYAHPEVLAEDCARLFPAKDSIGEPVITGVAKADNKDYSGQLDSLQAMVNELTSRLNSPDSNKRLKVDPETQRHIIAMEKKISALAANYTKCEPDTIMLEKPVFRTDAAKEALYQERLRDMTTQRDVAIKEKDEYKDKAQTRLWVIIGIVAVAVLGLVGRFVIARFLPGK